MKEPSPGRYRHFKGAEYSVLGVARHSESLESLVVYRQEYGDRALWVRPMPMFLEKVLVDGVETPRFRRVEADESEPSALKNLFADLPGPSPAELFTTLLAAGAVRIERIVSLGQASPDGFWYDQDHGEWVIVVQGCARLRFEDRVVDLKTGDFLDIPAHRKHRVDWTTPDEPTVWLAVHHRDAAERPPI